MQFVAAVFILLVAIYSFSFAKFNWSKKNSNYLIFLSKNKYNQQPFLLINYSQKN